MDKYKKIKVKTKVLREYNLEFEVELHEEYLLDKLSLKEELENSIEDLIKHDLPYVEDFDVKDKIISLTASVGTSKVLSTKNNQ